MKLKPIVPLMSLIFAATLTGCNLDGSSRDSDSSSGGDSSGGGSVVETSPLAGGYWEIGSDGTATLSNKATTYAAGDDLPNVYTFINGAQFYYDDDATPGTYTVIEGKYTDDLDAGTFSFTYYGTAPSGEDVTGSYTVTDGVLTIDGGNAGILTGSNHKDDTTVTTAVTAANESQGIVVPNQSARIIDTNLGGTTDDNGELRVKFSDSAIDINPISEGAVKVDILQKLQTVDIGTNDVDNSINIVMYGSNTSNGNQRGEIILTSGGDVKYRKKDKNQETVGTYTRGEKLSIEATWSAGDFSFTINGVDYTAGTDTPESGEVTVVTIKLGNSSKYSEDEVLIDNLQILSGSTVEFSDDFESYSSGEVLGDGENDPYSSSSAEATVVAE
ncbi:hypothetical protein [Vibrio algivorus]|uniref:Uncharacterized protein n=1 Tax=Vibrio algivorus TaxID=1667024 RepID=A0ABQ6ERS5_9VIBR|nr:hypothetical protein [Vibrio algivorus]GLT15275.1 hypothetical protein GCM10007931_22500 [Vibrio algivorus]